MHLLKEDIPVTLQAPDMTGRTIYDWGGMAVAYNELPGGMDVTPLLKGLKNDSCHCPHWGYIFEGAFKFIYDDGTEEVFEDGDVFYAPAGHTAIVEKDLKFVDFSPTKELTEVLTNVTRVMSEMSE